MATKLLNRAVNRGLKVFNKEKEKLWNGSFTFIQGADTQLGMIASYLEKKTNPDWEKEIALTTKAIESVNSMNPRPRFFVVCGDLIDAMPGTELRSPQEADFFKLFSKLHPDIPLVCVCGNHDIGNTPTPASIQDYREKFGDDYFTFYCAGVMFIVLNSQFYKDPSLVMELAKEHDHWLDEQLEEAKSGKYKHIIVFQHIPWFLLTPDEQDQYFNIMIDLRQKILNKLYDANVRAIFCGHYHRNAGGFYKDMEVIVTSAIGAQLGNDESGFRIVKVLEDSIKHNYYPLDEVPKDIDI